MYINKNELVKRLVNLTSKDKSEFASVTIDQLTALYESLASNCDVTYITVPYKDKNIAKLLGARYDGKKKKWYIPPGADSKLFSKWL